MFVDARGIETSQFRLCRAFVFVRNRSFSLRFSKLFRAVLLLPKIWTQPTLVPRVYSRLRIARFFFRTFARRFLPHNYFCLSQEVKPRACREIPTCRGGKNSTRSSVSTIRKALCSYHASLVPLFRSLYSLFTELHIPHLRNLFLPFPPCPPPSPIFSLARIRIVNF